MSKVRVPYQCLVKCGNILVAARGSFIDLFSLENQSLLSTWKCPNTHESSTGGAVKRGNGKLPENDSGSPEFPVEISSAPPPTKRRKLSTDGDTKLSEEEGNGKKKINNRSQAASSGLDAPAIITLTVTKDGQHVIAVSGEDKSIRVFEHLLAEDGKTYLNSLSQRAMPKRPCAVSVTQDGSTIITADKFGDVYSLPLLFSQLGGSTPHDVETSNPTNNPMPKLFVPAANNFTVHSQRNRKALENQKRQANKAPEKSEPSFEHKLLLGHVSMLTDISLATFQGRDYIISADRDEHVRISRGIPQSHIIEGFCLGHTEFISRLCIPQSRPDVLLSGGGDNELFVWNWLSGTLVSKADLQSLVADVVCELEPKIDRRLSRDEVKVAVSSITYIRLSENEDIIIVTSEGVPALFTFLLTRENTLKHIQTVRLPGNALAVVGDPSQSTIAISVDSIHKPCSTTERRVSTEEVIHPLQSYRFQGHDLVASSTFEIADGGEDESQSARLTNLLYNLENLRKRDGEAKEAE